MLIGMFADFWQRARPLRSDPAGRHRVPIPDGYHTYRSPTYNVFLFCGREER
jgi:hypothetical protein